MLSLTIIWGCWSRTGCPNRGAQCICWIVCFTSHSLHLMEIPQAHLAHTVGAGEDRQAHGVQSRTKMEKNIFCPMFLNFHATFNVSIWQHWFLWEEFRVTSHLAAQPQRETIHAAIWIAKGSEQGVSPILFCSSSITCSILLITSSVKDCKERVANKYRWTSDSDNCFYNLNNAFF